MKTVVIDARQLRTSTGRYIERLLHNLQQVDSDYRYIVLLYPQDIPGWTPTNPQFETLACPYAEFTLGEQVGMLQLLNNLKADLVHFGMTQQPLLYKGCVVTTIHDLTPVRYGNPSRNKLIYPILQQAYAVGVKHVAKKSRLVITPTQYVKNDLATYAAVDPIKITVTPEAADIITADPEIVENLNDRKFILYVGRPQPHKNLMRLIDAFTIVKKKMPDLRLVLAGKTDKAFELLKVYTEQQNTADVIYTGFVSEGQLRWLYEHATVYVFPSLSEGFGLPGLEAMHYGLPVVSSNATCLPEVYGDAALYFDPTNIDDIAEKVSAVLDSPELALKLAAAGKEQVRKYSWQRMAEQTLAAYDQVLDAD